MPYVWGVDSASTVNEQRMKLILENTYMVLCVWTEGIVLQTSSSDSRLAVSLFLSRWITKPLTEMTSLSRKMREGILSYYLFTV